MLTVSHVGDDFGPRGVVALDEGVAEAVRRRQDELGVDQGSGADVLGAFGPGDDQLGQEEPVAVFL